MVMSMLGRGHCCILLCCRSRARDCPWVLPMKLPSNQLTQVESLRRAHFQGLLFGCVSLQSLHVALSSIAVCSNKFRCKDVREK